MFMSVCKSGERKINDAVVQYSYSIIKSIFLLFEVLCRVCGVFSSVANVYLN